MKMRSGFIALVFIAAWCEVGLGQGGATNKAAIPLTMRIGYLPVPGAEAVGRQSRMVEDGLGVPVEWTKTASGREAVAALAADKLDIAMADSCSVARGIAERVKFLVVWVHAVHAENLALMAPLDGPLRSARDLSGRSVGVTYLTCAHYQLERILESRGIPLDKVRIQDMSGAGILAAWKPKGIDAAFVSEPELSLLKGSGGLVLSNGRELMEEGLATADLCIVATKFAARYPAFLSRYIDLQNKSVMYCRDNPAGAAAALMESLKLSEAAATNSLQSVVLLPAAKQAGPNYLGLPNRPGNLAKGLRDVALFLERHKAIPATPVLRDFESACSAVGVGALLRPPPQEE